MSANRSTGLSRVAVGFGLAAFLCALAAFLLIVFSPCFYRSVSATAQLQNGHEVQSPVQEIKCHSLVQSQGLAILVVVGIPVALALLGGVGLLTKVRPIVWLAALASLGFAILTGFSIGLFFLPAAWLLVVAAILQQVPGRERQTA